MLNALREWKQIRASARRSNPMKPAAYVSLLGVEIAMYFLLLIAFVVFLIVWSLASGLDNSRRFWLLFKRLRTHGFRITWRLYRVKLAGLRPGRQGVYMKERV